MKFCQNHWDGLRAAIDERGLSKFVAKSGQEVMDKVAHELKTTEAVFDPLMQAMFAILNNALEGGHNMYLLTGDYCPVCESEKHGCQPAEWWFTNAANDQLEKAKELGLI
jgi:hypothetical protein